jgi:outer membrane protein assembly factor BamA
LRSILPILVFYALGIQQCISAITADHGRTIYIRQILVYGNKLTKTSILLRELPFKEGDTIRQDALPGLLNLGKRQLINLALFHEVSILDSITSDTVNIEVRVRERWYIFPEPTFALADRNFNEWWRNKDIYRITFGVNIYDFNFRGRNEKLVLNLVGGWRQAIGMQYKIANLNKKKTIGLQLSTLYQVGHEVPYITMHDRLQFLKVNQTDIFHKTSAEAQLSYRRKLKLTHLATIGMEYFNIGDTIARKVNTEYLNTNKTTLKAFYASYRFIYQDLDYFYYPLKGIYFSAAVEKRGIPALKDDVNFMNYYFDLEKYSLLSRNLYVANSFKVQQSNVKSLPYIYSNALGYRDLVRGYEHYVINGSAYYILNNEVKTKFFDRDIPLPFHLPSQFNPIPVKMYFKLYFDAGYVVQGGVKDDNKLPNHTLEGYGAGIDIISYYDKIIRIEYSFNNLNQRELFLHYVVAF